ncbi:hypothetical protein D9756_005701 [Leucocoprinus leucothites]|uniref:Hydrophobin n=1 Tax=Leucocoprinus leucothites TaxID=201217 RepID=A0A8H5D735_9AGAR|nr:hypothetical protein D9756_005701 [Leucoagaricus leucothites]
MRATSVFTLAFFAAAASAADVLLRDSSCQTGSTQCCSSTQSVDAQQAAEILGVFKFLGLPLDIGAILGEAGTLIGVSCNSIDVAGAGGNSCTTQPVCCSGNYHNGVLATGCIPISVNP